mmetsp:Transcript_13519/g.28243  ORF Transcript_13519/g.28243 Transcript_13519/m.28243 type:complete len:241 (-) Transcript_13519:3-725(-)
MRDGVFTARGDGYLLCTLDLYILPQLLVRSHVERVTCRAPPSHWTCTLAHALDLDLVSSPPRSLCSHLHAKARCLRHYLGGGLHQLRLLDLLRLAFHEVDTLLDFLRFGKLPSLALHELDALLDMSRLTNGSRPLFDEADASLDAFRVLDQLRGLGHPLLHLAQEGASFAGLLPGARSRQRRRWLWGLFHPACWRGQRVAGIHQTGQLGGRCHGISIISLEQHGPNLFPPPVFPSLGQLA